MKQLDSSKEIKQIIIKCGNGYGASILKGEHTITNENYPYELAVIEFKSNSKFKVIYPSFTNGDILYKLNRYQVHRYIDMIKRLKKKN